MFKLDSAKQNRRGNSYIEIIEAQESTTNFIREIIDKDLTEGENIGFFDVLKLDNKHIEWS